jgi:dTDP-glucose 4,6-dehydratase
VKLLVCGGLGFIGLNFINLLSESRPGFQITVLDKRTYAAHDPSVLGAFSNVIFVAGDICDRNLIHDLIRDHDAIVNFAAETHNDNSITQPERFFLTNVDGVLNLAEACRKFGKRLHHVSTDEVFGDTAIDSNHSFSTDSPYRPSSPYSASKASADLLLRAWHRTYGLQMTISNCTNNFGKFQHLEKLIPNIISRIVQGKSPQIYGDGKNVRDWINVQDHCRGVLLALENGKIGETYLFGASDEVSNLELANALISASGRKGLGIDFVQDRPGHDARYSLNWSGSTIDLGWEPKEAKILDYVDTLYMIYSRTEVAKQNSLQ